MRSAAGLSLRCLQARMEAYEAAKAERRAATAALRAVEGGIDFYAKAKNFDKLKEIAEASGVATKVQTSLCCMPPPPVLPLADDPSFLAMCNC